MVARTTANVIHKGATIEFCRRLLDHVDVYTQLADTRPRVSGVFDGSGSGGGRFGGGLLNLPELIG